MTIRAILIGAAIIAQPLVNEDVLEPSVVHEVEYALSRLPTNRLVEATARDFSLLQTNGLSQTALAIRLVSLQRADGRFWVGTNEVSAAAETLLQDLAR